MTTTLTRPAPVAAGTAEQLARVAHFREFEHTQPEELDAVATFLIGDTGSAAARLATWAEIRPDCLTLWHLVTDDWDDRDLDGLTDHEHELHSFTTQQQELEHRYAATRARLCADIERAIWHARCRAADLAGRTAVSA